jgi:hypothetical protein
VDGAEGVKQPESHSGATVKGRGRNAAGEVYDRGTHEEGDLATWEVLIPPQEETADGEPNRNLRRVRVLRVHAQYR